MSRRATVVVIVCIAFVTVAAIAGAPMFALIDAQTPVDPLFSSPASAPAPVIVDVALPTAPVVDAQPPRAPPLA